MIGLSGFDWFIVSWLAFRVVIDVIIIVGKILGL